MTTPTQTNSNDVLVEKVTRLIMDFEGVRDDIRTLTNGMGKIPVIEHELITLDKRVAGAFKSIDDTKTRVEANSTSIVEGRTLYRVMALISTVSVSIALGFTSWAWGQLSVLQKTDQELNTRIVTLEVKAIGNSAVQRHDNGEQSERMTKNGWVRDAK